MGRSLGAALGNMSMISLVDMIALLRAGLKKHHGKMSPEKVGDIMDAVFEHTGDVSTLMDAIAEAVNDAVPLKRAAGEDEDGGDPPNAGEPAAKGAAKKK